VRMSAAASRYFLLLSFDIEHDRVSGQLRLQCFTPHLPSTCQTP
jgi:hypothetical protein